MPGNSDCFGDMFPDLDRLEDNEPRRGKAFTVLVERQGLVASGRKVSVDAQQWDRCSSCEKYRNCYDLSMAKLLLTHVVDSRL